jgi:hypothetical protein
MSELTAYLISRLDAIGVFVVLFMCIIPLVIGGVLVIAGVADDTETESCKRTLRIVGIWLLVFGLFGAMLKTCIPSTQEMIMIKLAPKITDVENLKLLKANVIEITNAIGSALKN